MPGLVRGALAAAGRSAMAVGGHQHLLVRGIGQDARRVGMASSGLQQPAVVLLGRDRECAVMDRLLKSACAGEGYRSSIKDR